MPDVVGVEGLADLHRSLRKVDKSLGPAMRRALNEVAEAIAGEVRRKVPRGRTGRAAASVKAASSATEGRLSFGGTKAPYYPWLDFGGRVGRKHATVRPFIAGGRYVYPTIKARRADIERDVEAALDRVIAQAGLL